MRSSIRYNESADTRQPTVVIVDITQEVSSPGDASQLTPWPVFEPYSTSIRKDFTLSDVNPQLPSSSLDYFQSLTEVGAPVEDTSAMASLEVKITSTPHEASSDSRDDVANISSHVAVTMSFASWPLVTVSQGTSFPVETVNANEEAAETLSTPTSRDTPRLSPFSLADSKTTSSRVSTRNEEPMGARNSVGVNNSTTQPLPSPSYTSVSHETGSGKTYMTAKPKGLTLLNTYTETGNWTPSSSTTARTPAPGTHGAIMDGTEFSRRISQRGMALVLGSVLGGSLVFVCMLLLHRLILRSFHRSEQESPMHCRPSSMTGPRIRQSPAVPCNTAGISHFSADSEDTRCIDYQKPAKKACISR
ncbi:hypothetical protein N7490_002008 [Penicillium lividum]|nr:hypothetical protein N7490_002008 [Penicillium lividum]